MSSASGGEGARSVSAVRGVRVLGVAGAVDVLIAEGLISCIRPASNAALGATEMDGSDQLLLPGLVDAHVHLDKCYLLDRCRAERGDFAEAMSETLAAKRAFTAEDVRARAERLVRSEVRFGTTLLRTHVEVDPVAGLASLDAILALRDVYKHVISIQVCVFAQEGITGVPGQEALMRRALARGCDAVGSAPYCDTDPEANVALVFALAAEHSLPVDLHLDYHLEGRPSLLPCVLSAVRKYRMQGRVLLGHMTHLSTLALEELKGAAEQLRELGVSVVALPASDVCMMARSDGGNRRRGVAPIDRLAAMGVNAVYATNNVQNLFTFSGDGDVLKIGTLVCQLCHMTSAGAAATCLEMCGSRAALALGVRHGLEEGLPADLLLLKGASALEVLGAPPVERTVLKGGRVVARTALASELFLA